MAVYFSGREHAGENLAKVLKQRAAEMGPAIQMSDALSRNVPKLGAGVELLLANCMAHGRRQFVEVAGNFPASAAMYWRLWAECMSTTRLRENGR